MVEIVMCSMGILDEIVIYKLRWEFIEEISFKIIWF